IRKCIFFNKEVEELAQRLTTLFEQANWEVSPYSPQWGESNCVIPDPTVSGIWIGTPSSAPKNETRNRAKRLVSLLHQVPLVATLHFVRPDSGRAESRTSIQAIYDDPDALVVVVLAHN